MRCSNCANLEPDNFLFCTVCLKALKPEKPEDTDARKSLDELPQSKPLKPSPNVIEFESFHDKLVYNAQHNDADAQLLLGHEYYRGEDVPQDLKQAIYWFEKAAAQGSVDAQQLLFETQLSAFI